MVHVEAGVQVFGRYRNVARGARKAFQVGSLQQLKPLRVDVDELARLVEDLHAVRHRVEDGLEPPLAFAQSLLGALAIGDVEMSADAADRFTGLIALDLRATGEPADFARIGANDAELEGVGGVREKATLYLLQEMLAVGGMDEIEPLLVREIGGLWW